jgi:hypothetical protein
MNSAQTSGDFAGLEVSSGFYSFARVAKQIFGVSPRQLENTDAFFNRCEFVYWNRKTGKVSTDVCISPNEGVIPATDFWDIMTECFSGVRPVFLGTMAGSAGYGSWQTHRRAIVSVGSKWPINQDGAIWWMEQSSYIAGPMGVREITQQRELESRAQLLRVVTISGSDCYR